MVGKSAAIRDDVGRLQCVDGITAGYCATVLVRGQQALAEIGMTTAANDAVYHTVTRILATARVECLQSLLVTF